MQGTFPPIFFWVGYICSCLKNLSWEFFFCFFFGNLADGLFFLGIFVKRPSCFEPIQISHQWDVQKNIFVAEANSMGGRQHFQVLDIWIWPYVYSNLGCPPSQDASGKWRFRLGSPTKNVIVLVVTGILGGTTQCITWIIEQWKKPWLFRDIGDYTTQLYSRDYKKPI